jgi:hypothetical protein
MPGEPVSEGWNAGGLPEGGFEVYFLERGKRTHEKRFSTEEDALKFLAYCLIDCMVVGDYAASRIRDI